MGNTGKLVKDGSRKVLVVDDDSGTRQVLTKLLAHYDFQVESALNGQDAVKVLSGDHFDLLIIDVMMSDGDGIELMERMRLLFPEVIVVAISASNDIDAAIQAIRQGASGFLLKPFRSEEVELTIRTALENRKLQEKRERMRIMTNLVEAGKEVASSLDRNTLSRKLVDSAYQITDADTASLMLLNPERNALVVAYEIGLNREYGPGFHVGLDDGISGWALKRCFCLNMSRKEIFTPELNRMMHRNDKIESSICMPILSEGNPMGVLNVNRLVDSGKELFESSDVDFLSLLSSHAAVCIRNSDLFNQVQDLYVGSIQALSLALQAKDTYTGGHSERVAYFSMLIADRLGMNMTDKRSLWTAAILHDLGKIGTPEGILNKASDLDHSELEIVRNHPVIGADIIRSVPLLKHIAPIVLHHHEWYDGNGYPDGLSRDQIPLGSRILSIADAIEAMTSDRPYRQNCSSDKIVQELLAGRGTQFDPGIVDQVLYLIEERKIVL
ncbi:response regulator [bacterium]|nr:response regulator [candidate division CSSED10-310 bacterium]